MNCKSYLAIAVASLLSHATGMEVSAQIVRGAVTIQDPSKAASAATIDYVNAKPMDLPKTSAAPADLIRALTSPASLGTPGLVAGAAGNGQQSPVWLGMAAVADDEITPQEFGTNNHPFSTARADLFTLATNTQYPYRASGKLFFTKPGVTGTFVCSASLIKRGVVGIYFKFQGNPKNRQNILTNSR